MPHVRSVTPAERDRALATMTLAFSNDPMSRWVWPDAPTYFSVFSEFTMAFGGAAFGHGCAEISGEFAGAASGCLPVSSPTVNAWANLSRHLAAPRPR